MIICKSRSIRLKGECATVSTWLGNVSALSCPAVSSLFFLSHFIIPDWDFSLWCLPPQHVLPLALTKSSISRASPGPDGAGKGGRKVVCVRGKLKERDENWWGGKHRRGSEGWSKRKVRTCVWTRLIANHSFARARAVKRGTFDDLIDRELSKDRDRCSSGSKREENLDGSTYDVVEVRGREGFGGGFSGGRFEAQADKEWRRVGQESIVGAAADEKIMYNTEIKTTHEEWRNAVGVYKNNTHLDF